MALNKGNGELIEWRRERVAYWRLRHKTQREIVQLLQEEQIVNPDTKEPYSLATVNGDCKALRSLWKKEQVEAVKNAKAEVLAELRAVRQTAWDGAGSPKVVVALIGALSDSSSDVRAEAAKSLARVGIPDLRSVLQSLKQESELMGLDAPVKTMPLDPKSIGEMTDEELAAHEAKLAKVLGKS